MILLLNKFQLLDKILNKENNMSDKTVYIIFSKDIEIIKNRNPNDDVLFLGENFRKASRMKKIDLILAFYSYYRSEGFKITFICPKKLINDYITILGLSDNCITY